ncbi:alpha/beta fold hydrolase [Silanimonas sp.]|uniref:alpha/beta hydrolase family protein n=1 Tax=Silanimonas sp. TaxID=1929290 RepID=UPI001BC1D1EE|nr:alpha/beta fold hydrolase [Silanimonas sp.]MBS3896407.1 S9 family peptidase [Silanimonas sp.]MBS3924509.1 S9 family peptidase [Xanthomonadaceae bacterium]
MDIAMARRSPLLVALLLTSVIAPAALPAWAEQTPALPSDVGKLVDHLVRDDVFLDVALSPGGDYFAATVRREGRTGLVIGRVDDVSLLATLAGGSDSHVSGFWWVNDTQVVASMGESFGALEAPRDFGELWVLTAKKDAKPRLLAGWRGAELTTGTRLARNTDHTSFVFMENPLRNDDEQILVTVESVFSGGEGYATAERLDLFSGRRTVAARAPVPRASFEVDHAGEVRFAWGAGTDNRLRTFYRAGDGEAWRLVNDESQTGITVVPVGFAADNSVAYVRSSHPRGTDSIDRLDLSTLQRTVVLRDKTVDPGRVLFDPATGAPFGAVFMDGVPRVDFFDPESAPARTQRSLEAAFPGQQVNLRSTTRDGSEQLVIVSSDRNPGDYFHFDRAARKASLWASRSQWIDPEQMSPRTPIELTARDGLALHGYLTVPRGRQAKGLPTVVLVHGGPFNVRDTFDFDTEVQLLAARGYAVLQVNFRGSGGYGADFVRAGAREWGGAMQDDVTDATKWAIEAGHADPERICIVGSSYGAYAALMGAAREPGLYACAVGNVGVYDLDMMFNRGDIQQRRSGQTFLAEWIGSPPESASPVAKADRIDIPVFLAAGAEDRRAPVQHTRAMAAALEAAGNPAEVKIFPREGHGYFLLENRRKFYRRLLTFLDRHLGAAATRSDADRAP